MRQPDEASAKCGKVSNHGCQPPTKHRADEVDLQPEAGGSAKAGTITSPFSWSLIWGKREWKEDAGENSGRVHLTHVTVMCWRLTAVGPRAASSALLTWLSPVLTFEGSVAQLLLSLLWVTVLSNRVLYLWRCKTHLNAFHYHHLGLFTIRFFEMLKRWRAQR